MNRTIIIVLGLACAVISAVGIMRYNNSAPATQSKHEPTYGKTCTIINYGEDLGVTYYIRIEDHEEPFTIYTKLAIPTLKEMLRSNDNQVREEAKRGLKQLGVPEEEIQKAKEEK